MRVKLSKTNLANAKPSEMRYLLRDTRTIGLALKVEPSGTRTFLFEYSLPGKPSQRYNIGRYGEPWAVEQAGRKPGACDRWWTAASIRSLNGGGMARPDVRSSSWRSLSWLMSRRRGAGLQRSGTTGG